MDGLTALVGAGLAGGALVAAVVGLVVYVRRLDSQRAAMDRIIRQLERNTVSRESLLTEAQERQSRIVLLRDILISFLDLFAREVGVKALRMLIKEVVPQVFEDRIG